MPPFKRKNGKKLGRPKSENPRNNHLHVRLNDAEAEKLVKIMDSKDFSTTEAVRFAVNFTHDMLN